MLMTRLMVALFIMMSVSPVMASFVINKDNTVTDTRTGLMWSRENKVMKMNWEDAIAYCENSHFSGYTDWRLPNRYELQSLVDYSAYEPAIESGFFPGTESDDYWSSTPFTDDGKKAWYVKFDNGYVDYGNKLDARYFRAVRAGRPSDIALLTPYVTSLEVSPTAALLTQPGEEMRFLVKGFYNNGDIKIPNKVVWQTSDSNVVSVSGGKVIAIDEGIAVVSATVDDHTKKATVEVSFDPVSIDVSPELLFMEVGEHALPSVFALYPNGARRALDNLEAYTLIVREGLSHVTADGHIISALSAGTATVEVASGEVSTSFQVAVSAPVPLNIVPGTVRVKQGQSVSVKISGGTPPYHATNGTVERYLGEYYWRLIAPSEGGDISYTLWDNLGEDVDLKLVVLTPLDLRYHEDDASGGKMGKQRFSDPQRDIDDNRTDTISLTASGGTPPFSWHASSGEIIIDPSQSGVEDQSVVLFTPPESAGIYTVTVVDSGGQRQDIKVSTVEPLQTDPEMLYMTPGESRDVSIFGGMGPFTANTADGSVTPPQFFERAGVGFFSYTAPITPGEYMITVLDEQGNTVRLYVTVALSLTVSPSQGYLRRGQPQSFQLAGGVGKDEDIHIMALNGTVDSHPVNMAFDYTASEIEISDVISITDLSGEQLIVNIEIVTGDPMISTGNFFVTPSSATLFKNESRRFKAVGGNGSDIAWRCNEGEGEISGQGQPSIAYTAPDTTLVTELSATDLENREVKSDIHVISDSVLISPSQVYLKPGQQAEFQGNFGTGDYTFTWMDGEGVTVERPERDASNGNFGNKLLYTAPTKIGSHYVTLFDSGGNSDRAEVVVLGGSKRKKIEKTVVYEIVAPSTLPNSETQPVAVGDVQNGGTTFSMNFDFPNYEDDEGNRIPTNFYVVGFLPQSDFILFFDGQGGIVTDQLEPCMSEVTDAVYTRGLTFDLCDPEGQIPMEIFVLAIAAEHDPGSNFSFEPEDAPFELWHFDFSFPKCR